MSLRVSRQCRGNVLLPVIIVLVLAGLLAVGYFVVMGMAESEQSKKEAASTEAKPFDIQWATMAEIEEELGLELERWDGLLTCRSLTDREPFEREMSAWLSEDGVFYERLAAAEFADFAAGKPRVPREFKKTFEWWRGTVAGLQVDVEGWYREGTDRVKPIALSGEAFEGYMFLEGLRGPRECTFEAVREGSDQTLGNDAWGS